MKPGARLAVAAGLALLAGSPVLALDPAKAITQYSLQVWQIEDGLPENTVQAILQSRDGFVWIATQEGLVRFDGVRFAVFDKATTPAIRQNFIQDLAEGHDGSLWIATGGGGLSRLRGGAFSTYTTADGLPSNVVWSLVEDRQGTLWIGTLAGLCRYRDGRFTTLTTRDGLPSDRVLSLYEDRRGTLWIGTDGGGLARYSGGRFETLTTRDGLPADTVYAIREDRTGGLWVGTLHGLACLRHGGVSLYSRKDGLRSDRIDAILEDRDGSLWVGSDGGGLARLRGGRFESFTSRDGLSSDLVRYLCEDRDGSLWIGTRGGGVDRLDDGKLTTFTSREGLPSDIVWGVYEDRGSNLWIATDGGGLARFNDGRFRVYTTRDGLSSDSVRSLVEDHEGSLWIGTWGGGLNRFKDGRFRSWRKRDGLSHDIVRSVYEDREGNLWIGTYGGGLNRFRDGRYTVYTTKDGLGGDIVYCTIQDRRGDLWIGTRGGGLTRLHDGRFTTFTTRDGLSDDIVLSLYEDAQGSLWIGTRGGVNRLRDGRFTHVSVQDGLFDDVAYQILEDATGHLWMSSNRGLYRIAKRDYEELVAGRIRRITCASYGRADGMKSSECAGGVQPAGCRTRDGRLWFPTIEGVVMVDPARLRMNPRPPPVVIEQATIDGRAFDPGREAHAPPGRGDLQFLYAGLSFVAPQKVRFKRKLEGFDADWVDAGARREAVYTNIPSGSYTFRVAAANEDGVWNEAGAAFPFMLAPPVYRTAWFRFAAALLAALVAGGGYLLRLRQLEARERRLVSIVAQRADSLRQVALALETANAGLREAIRVKDEVVSIVAHDFRSPLTVIQGYSEMLEARAWDPEARRMLGIIHEQARRLASLAADTLLLSRIEAGSLKLEWAEVPLAELLRAQVEARALGPTPVFLEEAAALAVRADPERLSEVVHHVIEHAIDRSPAGGAVRVSLREQPEGARVSVADQGPELPPDELGRLLEGFRRGEAGGGASSAGLGLYVCKAIVEAHGGRLWAESGTGAGLTLRFVIPLAAAGAGEAPA